jgi:hypothetical protein
LHLQPGRPTRTCPSRLPHESVVREQPSAALDGTTMVARPPQRLLVFHHHPAPPGEGRVDLAHNRQTTHSNSQRSAASCSLVFERRRAASSNSCVDAHIVDVSSRRPPDQNLGQPPGHAAFRPYMFGWKNVTDVRRRRHRCRHPIGVVDDSRATPKRSAHRMVRP